MHDRPQPSEPRHDQPDARDRATCDTPFALSILLQDILRRLASVEQKVITLMLTAQQLKAELIAANLESTDIGTQLNEVETDIVDLKAKIEAGTWTEADAQEVLNELNTLKGNIATQKARATALAALHTPGSQP